MIFLQGIVCFMESSEFSNADVSFCSVCEHAFEGPVHDCGVCDRCRDFTWEFTESSEFPLQDEDFCVYAGAGDDCYCHFCQRYEEENARKRTEAYWRERISLEDRTGLHGRVEDDRKKERDHIARIIADSESFMWLMVGANHPESHLRALREVYDAYAAVDGGYGRYQKRHIPSG